MRNGRRMTLPSAKAVGCSSSGVSVKINSTPRWTTSFKQTNYLFWQYFPHLRLRFHQRYARMRSENVERASCAVRRKMHCDPVQMSGSGSFQISDQGAVVLFFCLCPSLSFTCYKCAKTSLRLAISTRATCAERG